MALNKFIPLSPDPYITSDPEMTLAKFGHLNTIVDYLNTYVVVDSLQLAGSGPITATARYISDSTGVNSAISISTIGVGIGTDAPVGILDLFKSAAATRLAIRGDAGQNRLISYRTGAVQRFGLYVNNTAESGSNAGSDFAIRTYSDAGTLLTTPLFIKRSTGNVGIGTTAPIANLQVNGTQVITNADITGYNLYSSFNLVRNGGTSIALDRFTGAPHFNLRAAGGTIASPTTQVGELGNIGWWSHSGTAFNRNVLLLARAENFVGGFAQTQRLSIGMGDSGSGTDYYYEMVNGNSYFGPSAYGSTPTARVQIKGSGSTSATTSLLVQNSAGNSALTISDDLNANFQGRIQIEYDKISFLGSPSNTYIQQVLGIGYMYYSSAVSNQIMINGQPKIIVKDTGASQASTLIVGHNVATSAIADASALLEVRSDATYLRGFLKPRMTTTQKNAIVTPAAGLEIYDTDLNRPCFYNGSAWVTL
jgi:hypothetical protein